MQQLIGNFIDEWRNPLPYVIAHTSGSTGTPKEIHLLKTDMRLSARATNRFFGISRHSHLHLTLSPDYIAGKMMIVRALEAECMLSAETPSNHNLLTNNPEIIDLLAVVPSQCRQLLNSSTANRCLRNVIVGGAPLTPDLERELLKTPWASYATYGMTETCSHVALRRLGQPVYHAMPGIAFETDNRNCLTIVAPHYSFRQLQTNDIVDLQSPTSFVWLGRFDNVINSGGIKLYPEQIEQQIQPHIPYPLMVHGIQHPVWGTAAELLVEFEPIDEHARQSTLSRITDMCRHFLPPHQRPKSIVLIPTLPRTANGKLRRMH